MKNIVKKQLPTKLAEKLANSRQEAVFNTYYIIDGDIYVHTEFYVDETDPSLTLMHDMAFLESEMIKDMQAEGKFYLDDEKNSFYELFSLALWFYDRIPSKDWQDLLNFLRLIEQHEGINNFIQLPSNNPIAQS
jgi:hypothetical protein